MSKIIIELDNVGENSNQDSLKSSPSTSLNKNDIRTLNNNSELEDLRENSNQDSSKLSPSTLININYIEKLNNNSELEDLRENSDQDSLKFSLLTSLKNNDIDQFTETLNNDSSTVNHVYLQEPQPGTLLDIACRVPGNSQFVKILLQRGANLNAINPETGKSPLHEAVQHSDLDTLLLLTRDPNLDVDIVDSDGKTALFYAIVDFKIDFVNIFNELYEVNGSNILSEFIKLAATHKKFFKQNKHLQDPMLKLTSIMEKIYGLKKLGLDSFTPIMKAAQYGYFQTLEKLLSSESVSIAPINGKTILHAVILGIVTSRNLDYYMEGLFSDISSAEDRKKVQNLLSNVFSPPKQISLFPDEKQDHYRCLEYILKKIPSNELDINSVDNKGSTALHYAVIWNETNAIEALLQAGADTCKANKKGAVPLRSIDPEILERHMDGCIKSCNNASGRNDYHIIFDYKMLMSPVTQSIESNGGKKRNEKIRESEPIIVMNDVPGFRKLLIHPLIRSYLDLKWRLLGKYFFYNLIVYFIYWFSLSLYLFGVFYSSSLPSSSSSSFSTTKTDDIHVNSTQFPQNLSENYTTGNIIHSMSDINSLIDTKTWRRRTLIFCTILMVREILQVYMEPKSYLSSVENWLEFILFSMTFGLLFFAMDSDWCSSLSVMVILGSWMELIFLLGRHPFFSTHVELFKTVSLNFLKFLLLYSIMIIAFAFSFYILFKNKTDEHDKPTIFQHFSLSVFKTLIMLTGEYDASSIPFGDSFSFLHIFFVLFLLTAIVIFNLLGGLAVGDTQKIINDAEIIGIVSRIKFIALVETAAIRDSFRCFSIIDLLLLCSCYIWCCCTCCWICLKKRRISRILKKIGLGRSIPKTDVETFDKSIILSSRLTNNTIEVSSNPSHSTWKAFNSKIIGDALDILRKTKQIDELSDHTECYKQIEEYKRKLQKVENILYFNLLNESRASKNKVNAISNGLKFRKNINSTSSKVAKSRNVWYQNFDTERRDSLGGYWSC